MACSKKYNYYYLFWTILLLIFIFVPFGSPRVEHLKQFSLASEISIAKAQNANMVPNFGSNQKNLSETLQDGSGDNQYIKIWKTVLNLCNIAVVVFLLFISFSTIFHINIDLYGVKKALPALLIGVVMANFSYFISRSGIEVSQSLTSSLINSVKDISGCTSEVKKCFADNITQAVFSDGLTAAWNSNTSNVQFGAASAGGIGAAIGWFSFFGLSWFAAGGLLVVGVLLFFILALIPSILFLILAFLLIIRTYVLLLLVVISPAAFLCVAWDPLKNYFKQWWSQYLKWVFMAPITIFLMWLIIVFRQAVVTPENLSNPTLATYAIGLFLLYVAVQVPFKMGGTAMNMWSGIGKKLAKGGWSMWGLGLGGLSNNIEKGIEIAKARGGVVGNRTAKLLGGAQQIVSLANTPYVVKALKARKEALDKRADTGGLKYSRFEAGKFGFGGYYDKAFDKKIKALEIKEKDGSIKRHEKIILNSLRSGKNRLTQTYTFAGREAYIGFMKDVYAKQAKSMPYSIQNLTAAEALEIMFDKSTGLVEDYKRYNEESNKFLIKRNEEDDSGLIINKLNADKKAKSFYYKLGVTAVMNDDELINKVKEINEWFAKATVVSQLQEGGPHPDILSVRMGKALKASGVDRDPDLYLRELLPYVERNTRIGGTSVETIETLWRTAGYNPKGPFAPYASPSASSSSSSPPPGGRPGPSASPTSSEISRLEEKRESLKKSIFENNTSADSQERDDLAKELDNVRLQLSELGKQKTTVNVDTGDLSASSAEIDGVDSVTTDPEAVQNQYLDKLIGQISEVISTGVKEGFSGLDLSQIQVDTGKSKLDAETALRPFQLATLSRVNDLKEKVFRMRMLRSLKNIATGLGGKEGVSEETVNNEINNIESNIDQSFERGEVPSVENIINQNPNIKNYIDQLPPAKKAEVTTDIRNYINISATEQKVRDHDFEPAMELMRAPMHSMVKEASVPESQASVNPQVLQAPEIPQSPTSFGKDLSKPQEQTSGENRFETTKSETTNRPETNEIKLEETPEVEEKE